MPPIHEMTEEDFRRFRPHIVVDLMGKRYELNPPVEPHNPRDPITGNLFAIPGCDCKDCEEIRYVNESRDD